MSSCVLLLPYSHFAMSDSLLTLAGHFLDFETWSQVSDCRADSSEPCMAVTSVTT